MLFREGDGEVLDLVFDAESHKELDEVSEVFDVVIIAVVCFDEFQGDYVLKFSAFDLAFIKVIKTIQQYTSDNL